MTKFAFTRRKRRRHFVDGALQLAILLLAVILMFRLGNMQLDGMLTGIAASLAVAIAFTSLMFNRARAVSRRRTRFKSLLAAELGLRSVLFISIGAAFTAITFPFLIGVGYVPTSILKYPTQLGPLVATFGATIPLCLGLWSFLAAVRALRPLPFNFLRAAGIRRNVGL